MRTLCGAASAIPPFRAAAPPHPYETIILGSNNPAMWGSGQQPLNGLEGLDEAGVRLAGTAPIQQHVLVVQQQAAQAPPQHVDAVFVPLAALGQQAVPGPQIVKTESHAVQQAERTKRLVDVAEKVWRRCRRSAAARPAVRQLSGAAALPTMRHCCHHYVLQVAIAREKNRQAQRRFRCGRRELRAANYHADGSRPAACTARCVLPRPCCTPPPGLQGQGEAAAAGDGGARAGAGWPAHPAAAGERTAGGAAGGRLARSAVDRQPRARCAGAAERARSDAGAERCAAAPMRRAWQRPSTPPCSRGIQLACPGPCLRRR